MQKSEKRGSVGRVSEGCKCSKKADGRNSGLRDAAAPAAETCRDRNRAIAEAYLAALKRRRYSRRSINTFSLPLKQFTSFLAARRLTRLQDVGIADIEAWQRHLQERRLSEATRNIYLRAVRNLFNWMESEGMLFDNPVRKLRIPRFRQALPEVHSEADIRRLLEQPSPTTALGIRDRAILEIGYSCALRREELASLSLHAPDLLQNTLRVTGKGRRERMLPIGTEAAAILRNYINNARRELLRHNRSDTGSTDALWINNRGAPLSGEGINHLLKQYSRQAGIRPAITPHALRRACATHMLRNGAHPIQIQLLLGHADMSHLSQYLRLTITDIRQMHRNSNPGK